MRRARKSNPAYLIRELFFERCATSTSSSCTSLCFSLGLQQRLPTNFSHRVRHGRLLLCLPWDGQHDCAGIRAAIAGEVIRAQDFVVNVHPPVETLGELRHAVDAIARLEDVRRASADEAFAGEKQYMVNTERNQFVDLVVKSLARLHVGPSSA
jgi:hypothetical protein